MLLALQHSSEGKNVHYNDGATFHFQCTVSGGGRLRGCGRVLDGESDVTIAIIVLWNAGLLFTLNWNGSTEYRFFIFEYMLLYITCIEPLRQHATHNI